jgi:hypothetical protein
METKDALKAGMRLRVLREGQPFIHPITKEFLGKVESAVGKIEIKDVQPGSHAGVIVEGEAREGDKVRISETKIKMMFCQDKTTDWYLADEYYRTLKQTERIEMIDTALETSDASEVIKEAKKLGAEVALLLTSRPATKGTSMRQQLFWISDGSPFIDMEREVDVAYAKELKFGEELFSPQAGEALLMYDLPFDAERMVAGDFDADGKQEIGLSAGNTVNIYIPAVDMQHLWEVKSPATDDHLWVDSIDRNRNGKDELIITSMRSGTVLSDSDELIERSEGGKVVSYIYEYDGSAFKELWRGNYFLRRQGNDLLAQAYSEDEGFAGDVFAMNWDGDYKVGEKVALPPGIALYDFVIFLGAKNEKMVFAYDQDGFLNLYNEQGIRTWRSTKSTGGFRTGFKKKSTVSYIDKGEWTVKDRLISRKKEVLVAERIPLAKMVKGIGHKNSRIKNYWWNGFSMEKSILIDDINGTILDYALVGDKLIVLTSPLFGIKFDKILKGENPLITVLYIYSIAGR